MLLWSVVIGAAQESFAEPGVKANGAIKFSGKRRFRSWSCLSRGLNLTLLKLGWSKMLE